MARVTMVVWNSFEHDARVLKEAQTLARSGHEVTVAALQLDPATPAEEILEDRLRVVRVRYLRGRREGAPARPPQSDRDDAAPQSARATGLRGIWTRLAPLEVIARRGIGMGRLLRRMLGSRPDVVHAHDVNVLLLGWVAARLARARLVYDAHEISTSREGYNRWKPMVAAFERRLMPRADACITTTGMRADFFARAYRIPRPVVLQNRPAYAEPAPSRRLREALGLADDLPIVLYQGGLSQGRGLGEMVRLLPQLPPCHIVFIGGGRIEGELRQLAAGLGLAGRAHFVPTVALAELPSFTASADIGLQPIRNTCFNHYTTDSNKLFEYCMAGLPVAASDFPEIRKIVVGYGIGVVFDPDDPESVAGQLGRLIRDPDLRQAMAARARDARRHLSWESQEEALRTLYRGLLPAAPALGA